MLLFETLNGGSEQVILGSISYSVVAFNTVAGTLPGITLSQPG